MASNPFWTVSNGFEKPFEETTLRCLPANGCGGAVRFANVLCDVCWVALYIPRLSWIYDTKYLPKSGNEKYKGAGICYWWEVANQDLSGGAECLFFCVCLLRVIVHRVRSYFVHHDDEFIGRQCRETRALYSNK